MLDFLIALLDRAKETPTRVISIADHDDHPPAIVYVDDSYSSAHSGLGIVLIDPLTGTKEYASALPPAWMLAPADIKNMAGWDPSMPEESTEGKTLIAQLEALAGAKSAESGFLRTTLSRSDLSCTGMPTTRAWPA